MIEVGATEFVRNFADLKRRAQREPVKVQLHGRTEGYFVSPEDFERFQSFMATSTKAYHPHELPPHIKAALDTARMEPGDDHLNEMMD